MGIDDNYYLKQAIEVDAIAFTHFFMKELYNVEIVIPGKIRCEVLKKDKSSILEEDMEYDKVFLRNYLESRIQNEEVSIEALQKHFDSIPKKLYRFRICTDDEFRALEEGYIWLSKPSDFKDVKDSSFKLEIGSEIKKTVTNLLLEVLIQKLNESLKHKNIKIDKSIINDDLLDEFGLIVPEDKEVINRAC